MGSWQQSLSHCFYYCIWANFLSFIFLPNIILLIMYYFFVYYFVFHGALLTCALLLIYAGAIFNRIVNNFEKFKFPVFLNVAKMLFMLYPKSIFNFYFYIQTLYDKQRKKLLLKLLLICCGDVESNPGPKKQHQIFFCHWKLNGLAARNFSKVSLLQTISVSKNYDLICLSEAFFRPINWFTRWKNNYCRI